MVGVKAGEGWKIVQKLTSEGGGRSFGTREYKLIDAIFGFSVVNLTQCKFHCHNYHSCEDN